MTFQSELQDAAEEYARRLDERHEAERLAALNLEARRHGNASAFAEAIEAAFTQNAETNDQETS